MSLNLTNKQFVSHLNGRDINNFIYPLLLLKKTFFVGNTQYTNTQYVKMCLREGDCILRGRNNNSK